MKTSSLNFFRILTVVSGLIRDRDSSAYFF